MIYLKAFVIGGLICTAGQLLIDLTKLTPAKNFSGICGFRSYFVGSGHLETYCRFCRCRCLVPIVGLAHPCRGMENAIETEGLIGIFTGSFTACAGGVGASLIFALIAAIFSKPNSQS